MSPLVLSMPLLLLEPLNIVMTLVWYKIGPDSGLEYMELYGKPKISQAFVLELLIWAWDF